MEVSSVTRAAEPPVTKSLKPFMSNVPGPIASDSATVTFSRYRSEVALMDFDRLDTTMEPTIFLLEPQEIV